MPIPVKRPAMKRQSAKMRIYSTLCDWIIYGTLLPGERLNDQEISDYFEVSRTPVREALQMLAVQKLVEIYPNKATVVTEIDMDGQEKWYLPLAHLHGLAAELCCRSITDEQLEELEELEEKVQSMIRQDRLIETLQEDLVFHERILQIAGNEFISEFSATLMLHIQRIEYAYYRRSGLNIDSFLSHRELLNALHRRDAEAASREMRRNWLNARDHMGVPVK